MAGSTTPGHRSPLATYWRATGPGPKPNPLAVTKGQVGRRPRTWLAATPAGRAAFSRHLAVLNQLATSSAGSRGDGTAVETEQVPGSA